MRSDLRDRDRSSLRAALSARVSTEQESIELQIDALRATAAQRIAGTR